MFPKFLGKFKTYMRQRNLKSLQNLVDQSIKIYDQTLHSEFYK